MLAAQADPWGLIGPAAGMPSRAKDRAVPAIGIKRADKKDDLIVFPFASQTPSLTFWYL